MEGFSDIDIAQVSGSSFDLDGFLTVAFDWLGDDAGVTPGEGWHPLGFIGVPMDPMRGASPDGGVTPGTIDQAANALKLWEGGRVHAMPLTDPRAMANLPNWAKGDAAMYAPSGYGNFMRSRADGRLELSTRTSDGNDLDVYVLISPDKTVGYCYSSPWGTQRHDQTGWHLTTQWGAAVDVGGWSDGGPLEQAGLKSAMKVRADSISLSGAIVKLGSGTGHEPVAVATTLAPVLGQIVTQVQALTSAVEGLIALLSTLATGGTGCTPAASAAVIAPGTAALGLTAIGSALSTLSGQLADVLELSFASKTTNVT